MIKANRIGYLQDADHGIELILCANSAISYPLHNHVSVFTIGLVLGGSIVLNTPQNARVYRKNQAFVIPPYTPHGITANESYSLISVCIHKNRFSATDKGVDEIAHDVKRLSVAASGLNDIGREVISRLLGCLYSFSDVFSASFSADIDDPYVDAFRLHLEMFPECRLSIEEMARAAWTSKYCFIRRFKRMAGLTPHQFQIQNRIRKAQRLIGKTDTITEVALTTGFCDQSHFIRQFERIVGLPPSTYKLSAHRLIPNLEVQQSAGMNLAKR